MRKNIRPVALLILVSNVLLCGADEITRTFILDPTTLGIPKNTSLDPQIAVKKFLEAAGVNFDAAPSPKFFYNTRTGMLHVTANNLDLDAIDKAVQKSSPPQVLVRVLLAEYSETQHPEIGKLLGSWVPDISTWPESFDDLLKMPRRELFSRVITQPEATKIIKALEFEAGTDLMTPPVRTTLSGHQVRVQLESSPGAVTIPPFHTPDKRTKAILDSFNH